LIRFVAANARAGGCTPAFLRVSAKIDAIDPNGRFFSSVKERGKAGVSRLRRQNDKMRHAPLMTARTPDKKKGPGDAGALF